MRTIPRVIPRTRKLVVSIKSFLLGGTTFDPASLFTGGYTGGWYDPSDLSTLWKDSARTIQVTADGDPVGCIDDKSGNGNHLIQATSGKRPLYKTSGGLHWLEFDGIDDELESTTLVNGANFTAVMARRENVLCGASERYPLGNYTGSTGYLLMRRNTDIGLYTNFSALVTTAQADNINETFIQSAGVLGTTSMIRKNLGTRATTTVSYNAPANGFGIGEGYAFSGNLFSGRSNGWLVINKYLSNSELDSYVTWLGNTKCGLSL